MSGRSAEVGQESGAVLLRASEGVGALLISVLGDPEAAAWQERGSCSQTDPEAFYPEPTDPEAMVTTFMAKRVCRRCEVTQECLDYALRRQERFGIWGGKTEEERLRMRR